MAVANLPLWVGAVFLSAGSTFTDPLPSLCNGERVDINPRIGYLNVRAIKVNHNSVCKLLNKLDFLAILEYWVHEFDLNWLNILHDKFCVFASSTPTVEDTLIYYAPRHIRGSGKSSSLLVQVICAIMSKSYPRSLMADLSLYKFSHLVTPYAS